MYSVLRAATSQGFKGTDFFETSAMLISFILLGKYLEVLAKGKTSNAIAKLMNLTPDTAILLTLDSEGNVVGEEEIDSRLIQKNDVIKVIPGAKVASVLNFERLDIVRDLIGLPSEKLLSFEFAESFCFKFRGSRYITRLNRTSK